MMRPSTLAVRFRSESTRAVIPTLVAHSVAPTNQWLSGWWAGKNQRETPRPSSIGATTPSVATRSEEPPTAAIFARSDSSPTLNRRNSTPIWANTWIASRSRRPSSPW